MENILTQYNLLTDNNRHNDAAILLVKHFGTQDELKVLKEIESKHIKNGHITAEDSVLRNQISGKYYYHLKQINKKTV